MMIQILGMGCKKCTKLYENATEAISILKIECELVKVEEMDKIIDLGVLITPALAIDGDVKSSGKILSVKDIVKLLEK